MIRRAKHIAIASLVVIFLASVLEGASRPQMLQATEDHVTAFFFATLPQDSCIQVGIFVIGRNQEELRPNPGTLRKAVTLDINSFDTCLGIPLVTGIGQMDNPDFHVDTALNAATLRSTVLFLNLFDGQLLYVDVDLAWVATGSPAGAGAQSFGPVPGQLVTFQGIQRPAVATGSVVIQPSLYDRGLGGVNLAVDPSQDAQIASAKTSTISLPVVPASAVGE
jgi:hypothetical protein